MQIDPTVAGLYLTGTFADRNERATAAQRAEDRKRLFEAVDSANLRPAPEVNLCASRGTCSGYTEVPSGDEYRAPSKS